jgi:hypothetical protein
MILTIFEYIDHIRGILTIFEENSSVGCIIRFRVNGGKVWIRRILVIAGRSGEGPFSIAASVKLRPDDFMLSPSWAPADDATRGSRFSSRSASGRLMMG